EADTMLQLHAANLLPTIGSQAVPLLVEVITGAICMNRMIMIRLSVLQILEHRLRLEQRPDARIVEALVAALSDEDAQIRHRVAVLLGKVHDMRAIDMLVEALTDVNILTRETSAQLLGKLGDASVIPAIEAAMEAGMNTGGTYRNHPSSVPGEAHDTFQRAILT